MDKSTDIRDFLTSRRARLTPGMVGLPDFGGQRRVKGLRREEVALMAGMSVEYYVRFERGNATGISQGIVDGVSRALQLDNAERVHLHDLVRAANTGLPPARSHSRIRAAGVSSGMQQLLDAMTGVPAVVQNGRLDVVASNGLGRALFHQLFDAENLPANFSRYLFLDDRSREFYLDWEESAEQLVALLRIETGRSPHDRQLGGLVTELAEGSNIFRHMWGAHDVREHGTGGKRLHHDFVGDLELDYQALDVSDERGLQLVAFTAQPGTAAHTGLQLLGNVAATHVAAATD